jgi:hypothetical protein
VSTRPESERTVHGPLKSFDLEAEISHLREEEECGAGATPSRCARAGG